MSGMPPKHLKAAVVGGGISGLISAWGLTQQGYAVDVYEAADRLGGKIQTDTSGQLGKAVVNLGAEFIDSEEKQPHMVALCKELGIRLIKAKDQNNEEFLLTNGTRLTPEQFYAAYEPLAAKIRADKAALMQTTTTPDGQAQEAWTQRAAHLNTLSLKDYLNELSSTLTPQELQAMNSVPGGAQAMLETVAKIYVSECGQDIEKASALQFVNEAGAEPESFFSSDCAYRVEGGTEKIINALEEKLKAAGAHIHTKAPVEEVSKTETGVKLKLQNSPEKTLDYDNVVVALPLPALGKLQGLESFGLEEADRKLIQDGQYTHSSKFFVPMKEGVTAPEKCLYTGDGFEAWTSEPSMMTFLAGGEKLNEMKGTKLINYTLEKYAAAHGMKAEDMFDMNPQHMVFGGPNLAKPCYASPAPGQAMGLSGLWHRFSQMAEQGLGVVGTFLPVRGEEGGHPAFSIGFMESGAASAAYMTDRLIERQQAQAVSATPQQPGFVDRIGAQNSRSGMQL